VAVSSAQHRAATGVPVNYFRSYRRADRQKLRQNADCRIANYQNVDFIIANYQNVDITY
jgi:hypothetical protein